MCQRRNACLTCDKFATDRSYLPEHEQQLDLLGQLIDARKQAFQAKTGREMRDENVWLAERRKEQQALTKIIASVLKPDVENQAVGGAGNPDLRRRIEHLRTQQQGKPTQAPIDGSSADSNVIRALTAQLAELRRRHREEVDELRAALAAAHGENLQLRRKLGMRKS